MLTIKTKCTVTVKEKVFYFIFMACLRMSSCF